MIHQGRVQPCPLPLRSARIGRTRVETSSPHWRPMILRLRSRWRSRCAARRN